MGHLRQRDDGINGDSGDGFLRHTKHDAGFFGFGKDIAMGCLDVYDAS